MPAIQAVFSILNMAPKTIPFTEPLSTLQVLAGEISNPGCIELLPAEKLTSHVDGDCQVAAAGKRRSKPANQLEVRHPAQLVELQCFTSSIALLFSVCSSPLIL